MLSEGSSEDEIKAELGLTDGQWARYRSITLESQRRDAARPPLEIFLEYQARQLCHIDRLEDARQKAMTNNQPQHAVSAVKAQGELLDRIVQRGQDLGVYHKEGQRITVKGALGLVHMTSTQLAEQLDRGVTRLKALSEDLGHPLTIGDIGRVFEASRAPLRLVEPPRPEPEPVDPYEETDPGPPPPDTAVPEPVEEPEVTVPERRRRGTTGLKHGDGDPGPDHPLAERLYEAAMHPRADDHAPSKPDDIKGDPAGLRGRVFIQCPVDKCAKRVQGVPGLTRHLTFLHQMPEDEARAKAQEAAERERMAVARAYVARVTEEGGEVG